MKVSSDFNSRASSTPREAATQSKYEHVKQFAESQYVRCKDQWTAKNYDRLLKREGNAPSHQPSWATNDRKSHMMRAASLLTDQRRARNIQRVDRAADRMAGRKRDGLER